MTVIPVGGERKVVSKNRPHRKQVFWLLRFLESMKEDLELGKYCAAEVAAMANAQMAQEAPVVGIEKFEWVSANVKDTCRDGGIKFKSKRPVVSSNPKSGWARRSAKLNQRFAEMQGLIDALTARVYDLETGLGVKR